jgi:hypothetical protein
MTVERKAVMTRRRVLTAAGALALAGLLASCANLVGPRRVELPQARLQAGLERRFPLHNRMLELFDVQLTHPRLTIQPETDRVALTLDVSVAPPFLRQSWSGTMALSGRLVLDASRARDLGHAADLLVSQLVRDMPVYTFRTEDLRYAGIQFMPTSLRTEPGALVVTLEPQR